MPYYSEKELRIARIKAEANLIRHKFGVQVSYDTSDGTWFHVRQLRLPYGWNRPVADVLIDIPSDTPGYPRVAPEWFWTNRDLSTSDGRSIQHFFIIGQQKVDPYHWDKGYGHFCIHLSSWKPLTGVALERGDNLATYLKIIMQVFHDRKTLVR